MRQNREGGETSLRSGPKIKCWGRREKACKNFREQSPRNIDKFMREVTEESTVLSEIEDKYKSKPRAPTRKWDLSPVFKEAKGNGGQ